MFRVRHSVAEFSRSSMLLSLIRRRPLLFALCASTLFGVLFAFILWRLGDLNRPGRDEPAGMLIFLIMQFIAFVLGFAVRRVPWIWGVSMKTGQVVAAAFLGTGQLSAISKLFPFHIVLALPLVLAGFLGSWTARASSGRIKVMILACFGILIVFEIWLWDFLRIDTCLDLGGRWNRQLSICEYE